MHRTALYWGEKILSREICAGKDVLEVGSYNVNGSFRPLVERWGPKSYVGVDMREGPNVDVVCNVYDLPSWPPVDMVISTEMLEHVEHWALALEKMWGRIKVGGLLVLTTRGPGFPKHDYPNDYWRFTPEILGSWFERAVIEPDAPRNPGVLLVAQKVSGERFNGIREALPV